MFVFFSFVIERRVFKPSFDENYTLYLTLKLLKTTENARSHTELNENLTQELQYL